jgi:hypothetical protein
MPTRPVSEIIEEWRVAERELDQCATANERIELDRRIAALQDEHRAAVADQDVEAGELGSSPTALPLASPVRATETGS